MNDYIPQPDTIAARVVAHFASLPPGTELATGVLADKLDVDGNILSPCLATPVRHGLLARERREGRVYWRRGSGSAAPALADDDDHDEVPPVQRVVKAPRDNMPLLEIPRFPGVVIQAAPSPEKPAPKPAPKGAPREASGPHALKSLGWLAPPTSAATSPAAGLPFVDPDAAFETPPPSQPNPAPTSSALQALQNGKADTPAPGHGQREAAPQATEAPPAAPITAESGAACGPAAPACQNGTSTALTPTAPMRCAVWSDGTLAIEKDGQTQTYTPDETRAIVRYLERVLVGEGAE